MFPKQGVDWNRTKAWVSHQSVWPWNEEQFVERWYQLFGFTYLEGSRTEIVRWTVDVYRVPSLVGIKVWRSQVYNLHTALKEFRTNSGGTTLVESQNVSKKNIFRKERKDFRWEGLQERFRTAHRASCIQMSCVNDVLPLMRAAVRRTSKKIKNKLGEKSLRFLWLFATQCSVNATQITY